MNDEGFIRRCFDLARLGAGAVSPNPMVGAVLVHNGKIIGEGWHQRWGAAHAEPNCLQSVSAENRRHIPYSTLYCNLEPCSHHGKTPPCSDLILEHGVKKVVVSNVDPNPLVAGKGLAKLKNAGVEIIQGILEAEGIWLNRVFFNWISKRRPWIILKWAQSADGFMGQKGERVAISSPPTARLVHRWRSESDAILVGTETAVCDNPRLDNRFYFGKPPLRIAFDLHRKIPASHHLFDDVQETWIYGGAPIADFTNESQRLVFENTRFIPSQGIIAISDLLETLRQDNRASLLVEGGANLLSRFLSAGYWDEIRVIENARNQRRGIAAPLLPEEAKLMDSFQIGADKVRIFTRQFEAHEDH